MTSLAIPNRVNGAVALPPGASPASSAMMTLQEVWQMAEYVASSGLFAVKTPEQAFTLMMLCQAEGLHPILAMRRYHIVEGRPSMRADAMQAEFQSRGGTIKIVRSDATEARAVFAHPVYQPDGFEFSVTYEQFKASGWVQGKEGTKTNWKHSPADMLWARLVTKAIRKIYPGIVAGIYSTEEVQDIVEQESPAGRAALMHAQAEQAVAEADVSVTGYHGTGYDQRQYREVVADGVGQLNDDVKAAWVAAFQTDKGAPKTFLAPDAHLFLINRAVQLGKIETLPASKADQFASLKNLYRDDRAWVRAEVQGYLAGELAKVEAVIREKLEAAEAVRTQGASEDNDDLGDIDIPY